MKKLNVKRQFLVKIFKLSISNYIIKPMVGVIRRYQIIAVQLQPIEVEDAAYIEHWSIELNGQKDRLLPIYIKGHFEWPRVVIGRSNCVDLGYVHPGCEEISVVAMKNLVSYPIQYNF